MADSKITDLVDGVPPATNDWFVIARGADNFKITLDDLVGLIRDRLENGGAQELDVAGLSGDLADLQDPKLHASAHQNGGGDEVSVAGLSGELADAQKVAIHKNGTIVGTRKNVNLIEGTNITLTVADDAGDDEVDVTIAASGSGGAPTDAEYIVGATHASLSAERLVTNTATVEWDLGTAGQAKANVPNDSITYAKIQNVAADDRFLGRISGAGGDIEELTGTQATTLLDVFTDALKGLVPASGGGTTTFLRADGSFATPSAGAFSPYFADHTDYNTDNTENNVFTGTVTGDDLGATGGIVFIILGSIQQNSGSGTLTIRLKFGSTTLFGDVSTAITNSATRRGIVIVGGIWNNGATNAQFGVLFGALSTVTAGSVAGAGDFATGTTAIDRFILGSGSATEDTTSNKTLSVSFQFSVSNSAVGASTKGFAIKI